MLTWIADRWCELFHGDTMWPSHGAYRCRKCLKQWEAGW